MGRWSYQLVKLAESGGLWNQIKSMDPRLTHGAAGAGLGALTGAGLGYLTGRGAGLGALTGGLAGAGVGAGVGHYAPLFGRDPEVPAPVAVTPEADAVTEEADPRKSLWARLSGGAQQAKEMAGRGARAAGAGIRDLEARRQSAIADAAANINEAINEARQLPPRPEDGLAQWQSEMPDPTPSYMTGPYSDFGSQVERAQQILALKEQVDQLRGNIRAGENTQAYRSGEGLDEVPGWRDIVAEGILGAGQNVVDAGRGAADAVGGAASAAGRGVAAAGRGAADAVGGAASAGAQKGREAASAWGWGLNPWNWGAEDRRSKEIDKQLRDTRLAATLQQDKDRLAEVEALLRQLQAEQ